MTRDELLSRLEDAYILAVPEREREYLCAAAHAEIVRLVTLLDEMTKALEDRQCHKAGDYALIARVKAAREGKRKAIC